MGSMMPHEVGVGNESCPTLPALVGLLPSVGPLVHSEAGPLPEGLATLLTCVRLLTIVDSLVNKEV